MKIKAVCFDMDGTLIRNTDSVKYLCLLNNNLKAFHRIDDLEKTKSISWIEGDYLKAELIEGLAVKDIEDKFEDNIELVQNIDRTLIYLREKRIKAVLITAGPAQVANILGTKLGFDSVHGSLYEVKNHKLTGRITTHLGNNGKLNCLKDFCVKNSMGLDNCVAIGDNESDIEIFEKCGKSIAINYSDAVKGKASEYIITNDLSDIVNILESWSVG